MGSTKARETLIQCDFDGTITEEDVSFILLDAFADGDWRRLFRDYQEGRISVGLFNTKAFAMVKADKQRLLEAMKGKVIVRPGFHELVAYCRTKDLRFVIVSNGLDFYIEAILRNIGVENIEVFAAQTRFLPEGLQVQYIGPDGRQLNDGFKEAFVSSFLRRGYHVVYVGNGPSDVSPAKQCHHIFATGQLLASCKETKLNCTGFNDFHDIVRKLQVL